MRHGRPTTRTYKSSIVFPSLLSARRYLAHQARLARARRQAPKLTSGGPNLGSLALSNLRVVIVPV